MVIFDEGPVGPIGEMHPVNVRRNGKVTFKNVKLHINDCSLSGTTIDQLVYLDRGRIKNISYIDDEKKYISLLKSDPNTIKSTISFVIKSANRPFTMKVSTLLNKLYWLIHNL